MGQFFGEFEDEHDVISKFEVPPGTFDGVILVAQYSFECYDGSADVLFRGADGFLYEVHGSHCSCFGLENQWEPELVEVNEFRQRVMLRDDEYSVAVQRYLPVVCADA